MKQLKVALPDELRAQLDAASAKSGRSVADEIRTRVERSLELDALDRPTRDFIVGVALMPAEIERETAAAWHKHAGAWAAFRQAIISRLKRLEPKGPIAFGKRPHQSGPGSVPEDIGMWAESHLWENPNFTTSSLRKAMEQTYREIAQKGNKA
jgi:hypothetical protein